MSAPLSIIIPTLQAEKPLIRLLPQIFDGLSAGLIAEVIFADGGSTDATERIADEVGALFVSAPRGRGQQLVAGADAAKGQWLLFLHADSLLPKNWTELVHDHMHDQSQHAAAFSLAFDDRAVMANITASWANFRSRRFQLPYGDQGLLIPASLYRKVGGFDPIPLMEDVAIAKKLKGRIRILPGKITTSAERYRKEGWINRGARNLWTLLRYHLGVSPQRLINTYEKLDQKQS